MNGTIGFMHTLKVVSFMISEGGTIRNLTLISICRIRAEVLLLFWDERNEVSESVASGLYFFTFTAGKFVATRRMSIRK